MAKNLFQNKLGLIGTIRSNKNEIPESFLPSKENKQYTSKFAFDEFISMVSYFCRPSKCAIVLSTVHHSKEILTESVLKSFQERTDIPLIVHDYNYQKSMSKLINLELIFNYLNYFLF